MALTDIEAGYVWEALGILEKNGHDGAADQLRDIIREFRGEPIEPRDLNGQDIYHHYVNPGPLLHPVVIVAAVNPPQPSKTHPGMPGRPVDWAAYAGGVPRDLEEARAVELVKDWGAKIPKQWAGAIFPHVLPHVPGGYPGLRYRDNG